QLIFLDDTAKYERSLSRTYGYSFSMSKSSFLRCVRYTILPALTLDGFIACDIMRCSCSKERYCSFVYRFISNCKYFFIFAFVQLCDHVCDHATFVSV
ncbi:hypothetical protein RhiirA5_454026, partial [Rhizophagus irregularis]